MSRSRSVFAVVATSLALAGSVGVARAQETPPPAAQRAARGSIIGTVTSREGNAPLDAVQIRVVGTSLGAVTRDGGRFVIANVSPGVYAVEALRIGYARGRVDNVNVQAGAPTTVNFSLDANALRLNDVIVSGVSDPTSGVKVPFVVTKLTAEDVPVSTLGSTANLLKGKVAGMVVRTSGGPGGGAFVQLRNPVSIRGGTGPMYIVDGVIMIDTFSGYTSEIDPADIASIEVIKGAAAAALYGSKAANGVISITTNRGQNIAQGASRYTLRSEAGFSRLGKTVPLATHHRWLVNADGNFINTLGEEVPRSSRIVDPNGFVDNEYGAPTYDRLEQLYTTGKTFTNQATIGQNTLSTNFLGTLGNTSETGVLRDAEGVQRYNVRLNVDHRAGDRFSLSLGAYYNRWHERQISDGDIFRDFIDLERDVDLLAPNPDGRPYVRIPDPLEDDIVNPLYTESIRKETQTRGGIQSNGSANYRFNDWLSVSGQIGYQRVDLLDQEFRPAGLLEEGTTLSTGRIDRAADFNEAMNGDVGASLVSQWGDFNARGRLSFAGEVSSGRDWNTRAESLTVANLEDMDIALRHRVTTDGRYDRRAKSIVGTTALEYKARYIVEGVFRRDGNSRYGPKNRWQNNGRVSGAWRAAEESWWPVPAVDEFKLRYSVGSAGNNPELNDQFQLFSYNNGRIIKTAMGNLALVPESVTEREMGVDISILNRFGIELTYARQVSTDLLRDNNILAFTGFDSQVQNIGTVVGKTYEATLEAHWFNNSRFRWNSTLVADRSRAKITKYNRGTCPIGGLTRQCLGVTFGEMYGYSYVTSPGELLEIHRTNGHVDWFDRNDDGLLVAVGPNGSWTDNRWGQIVSVDGRNYRWGMPIMDMNPDGTNKYGLMAQGLPAFQFGLTNNFTFGPFNAYVLLDGQVGGKNLNYNRMLYYHEGVHGDLDQAGKPEHRKKPIEYYTASISGGTAGLANGNSLYVDYFLESGTFMKLDELLIGYTIPSTMRAISRLGLERARVSLVGRNLYSFTKYRGYDPEVQGATTRLDDLDYPRYRTVSAQFEVVF